MEKEVKFEDKIKELEKIVVELENGEVGLDDAIDKYSHYYDLMYGSNLAFTAAIDKIYELYKTGEDVYLECYCKKYNCKEYHSDEIRCHGDVIKEKLERKLLKEKIQERMKR